MTNDKVVLSEIIGDAVEYDALTGTFRKKLKPLIETDAPGSEFWSPLGQPRKTLTDDEKE